MLGRDAGSLNSDVRRWRENFAKQHGGMDAAVQYGMCFLFPDGAFMEATAHGTTSDPPTNPIERQTFIVKYREIQVKAHEDAFRARKWRHLVQFHGETNDGLLLDLSVNQEQDFRELMDLQKATKQWRKALDEARAKLAKLKSPYKNKQEEMMDKVYERRLLEHRLAQRQKVDNLKL